MLSPHFSLEEMIRSDTAARLGIPNDPGPKELASLKILCGDVLEPLRKKAGALIVTSGYRGHKLNSLTPGSSKTSDHIKGCAADLISKSLSPLALCRAFLALEIPFGQLILEYDSWMHVSLGDKREVLTCRMIRGRREYLRELTPR